jgi:hypothetical protein
MHLEAAILVLHQHGPPNSLFHAIFDTQTIAGTTKQQPASPSGQAAGARSASPPHATAHMPGRFSPAAGGEGGAAGQVPPRSVQTQPPRPLARHQPLRWLQLSPGPPETTAKTASMHCTGSGGFKIGSTDTKCPGHITVNLTVNVTLNVQ